MGQSEINAWDSQEWTNLPKLSHNLQKHLKSHEHFPAPKHTPDNTNEIKFLKQRAQKNTITLRDWSWAELEMEAETHWLKQERPTENAGKPQVRKYKCWCPLAQWREKAEAAAQLPGKTERRSGRSENHTRQVRKWGREWVGSCGQLTAVRTMKAELRNQSHYVYAPLSDCAAKCPWQFSHKLHPSPGSILPGNQGPPLVFLQVKLRCLKSPTLLTSTLQSSRLSLLCLGDWGPTYNLWHSASLRGEVEQHETPRVCLKASHAAIPGGTVTKSQSS